MDKYSQRFCAFVLTISLGSLFYQCEDGGYWDLQENIHIFSHPTLENLTIRRAKLDHRGFEGIEQPSETPLKELHLIECDINDDGLSDLLLIPEALQEITISQLQFPLPPLEESPDDVEELQDLLCYTIENKDLLARKLQLIVVPEEERDLPPKLIKACSASKGIQLSTRIG